MKHIGVIGSGCLAQAMARAWQQRYRVTLTSRNPEKQQKLNAQGLNCEIHNLGEPLPFLTEIDALIIATTSKDLSAHQLLLNQLQSHRDLPLLFTSSTSVYPNDGRKHAEDSPHIRSDHPLFLIEHCLQQHPGTTIIRCGGLIGPGRHPGRFFRDKTIPSPLAPVNLLPLVDAVGIFWHVMTHHLVGTTINACYNQHPAKGDYYPKMAQSIDLPAPEIGQDGSPGKIVDTRRLTEQLNYQFKDDIWQIEDHEALD